MWIGFYIYFVVCVTIIIPNIREVFIDPKNAIFTIGAFIMFALSFLEKKEGIRFSNKWIASIFIYTIISFGIFFFSPIMFSPPGELIEWNIWNFMPTINLIAGILLIKTLYEQTDSYKRWIDFGKVASWLGFICSAYLILQFFHLDQFLTVENGWFVKQKFTEAPIRNPNMTSFLGSPYFAGNFIAIISPMCLMFKELRYKMFYGIMWIGILASQSSIAIITGLSSLLMYLILMKRWKAFILLIIILANLLVLTHKKKPDMFYFNGRDFFWKVTLLESKKNFIIGRGLGNFEQSGLMFGRRHVSHVHNDFIEILFDGGIVLLIMVVGYLVSLFRKIIYSRPDILLIVFTSAIVGFLINCQFSFPMRYAPFALIGIIYLAFLEYRTGDNHV